MYPVEVRPAPAVKSEPVSSKLVRTLVHPDRSATIWTVRYNGDGSRLFAAGYPSGVIQLWDPRSGTEVRRIESPRGYRGSADYAEVTADWSTVFVPVETRREVVRAEAPGGGRADRVENDGEVRTWDLTTGKPRPPVKIPGRSPIYAIPSPDGTKVVTLERQSFNTADKTRPPDEILLRDAATGAATRLGVGFAMAAFAPDGKRFAVATSGRWTGGDKVPAAVDLFDPATGANTARLTELPQGSAAYYPTFSPDGKWLAAELRAGERDKGSTVRVWDAATGAVVADLAPPKPTFLYTPRFSPDGRFVTVTNLRNGVVVVWDVAGRTPILSLTPADKVWVNGAVVSHDGKRLAVVCRPEIPADAGREPDPADVGQPWVDVYDLSTGKKIDRLACPHGFAMTAAFSPDGTTLAVGTSGGVLLFDVSK